MNNRVYECDASECLEKLESDSVDLVYVDPPFNTGRSQSANGYSYSDNRTEYVEWVASWAEGCKRVLKPSGTAYIHLDDRSAHLVRSHVMSRVFGEENYLSTVIWSYDYGGRAKDRWAAKHDTILVYAKQAGAHLFNTADVPRIPYLAPEMQHLGRSKEEAEKRIALGKLPTDVWQMSIVGTNSRERTGYPTQKPVKLVERAVLASSPPGGSVLDVFAGTGTTGIAAHKHGRSFLLADNNAGAINVMKRRLAHIDVEWCS